ncbi:MAG: TolC family protein, partial [Giesbergeria sp.]
MLSFPCLFMWMPYRVPRALPATFVLACLVAGCAAPPKHALPTATAPAAWKEGAAAQANFWHPAQPGEGVQADWWTRYGDPVLNRLEVQAQRGNPGLAQSAARLRAAQAAVASARAPLLPQLGLTAGSTRAQAAPGGSPANSQALGVSASWEVDLWGRVAG